MTKAICMLHGKEVCKICHGCEDCGINACVHTDRGKITREVFAEVEESCDGNFSNELINKCQLEIEKRLNAKYKKIIVELEAERALLTA